ncbi:hypothetical protein [Paraburkholderia sp. A3RO-2L]|uniref:hypothetical protein n=1 Tax=Paraburkholderia sp. A3RO-2L TaxID=3028376 RepID=UPI003DA8E2E0
MLLPIFTSLFFVGLTMQMQQMTNSGQGAGFSGARETAALVHAQTVETFAAACVEAAYAAPGVISANLPVVLPAGVIAPAGSGCITTAGPPGGRYVYAYAPNSPGAISQVSDDSGGNAAWYQVLVAGQAVNAVTGTVTTIPQSIPVASLLEWVQTKN